MKNKKPAILIIDDTPTNINILTEALQAHYEIKIATSGIKAIELVQQSYKPDLILLDIIMPEIDGYEVCRRLKENEVTKNIPVIFVTGCTESEDEEHGFNLGAVDYISKPYKLPVVLARIRNHLNLKRKSDLLESFAALDGLTGIPNRRRFDETYSGEWRRAVRSGRPLSLVMMDIDYFKQYNDNYGHGAGDDCLIQVASCLSSCVSRPCDLVARYGGEEFVALLPLTDAAGAQAIAERLVANTAALTIPHGYSAVSDHITISAGCATVYPLKNAALESLLQTADLMLYRAKSEGRNRVCC